ncbi:unnamed protein product, partial [marine sediment metagenome]
ERKAAGIPDELNVNNLSKDELIEFIRKTIEEDSE